jgi:signal transduction histidine kinase
MSAELDPAAVGWREPVIDRALIRVGIRNDVARIIAATPAARSSWLLAILGVALFVAWGDRLDPHVVTSIAALAPIAPIVGIAAVYGPWSDPMFDVTQASPASGFRILLLRSTAVLVAASLFVSSIAVVAPEIGIDAVAWLLPSLALCTATVMLSTFIPIARAGVLVGAGWLALAIAVTASGPADAVFQGSAQVGFCLLTIGASLVLVRRRQHLEIANLRSRRVLMDATDAERRRIERNIHDGAQQQLVAIGVKAGLARTMVTRDPVKAIEILDQVCVDAEAALTGLREMTRGALPPILADHGLADALTARVKTVGVPVTVQADGVGRLPEAVEVAAYYCCSEALQNAAKYAGASSITVTLQRRIGSLVFSIVDDGRGFEPSTAQRGTGMRSMSERIGSIGGTLYVRSVPGSGTTISATIPLG